VKYSGGLSRTENKILDEMLHILSAREIVETILKKKVVYCLIDLRQGYNHLVFKVSTEKRPRLALVSSG
jgi:hypothetical protein